MLLCYSCYCTRGTTISPGQASDWPNTTVHCTNMLLLLCYWHNHQFWAYPCDWPTATVLLYTCYYTRVTTIRSEHTPDWSNTTVLCTYICHSSTDISSGHSHDLPKASMLLYYNTNVLHCHYHLFLPLCDFEKSTFTSQPMIHFVLSLHELLITYQTLMSSKLVLVIILETVWLHIVQPFQASYHLALTRPLVWDKSNQ